MGLFQILILAAIQGLTEFLPVSSSGHTVLAKTLLNLKTPGAVWEVALHLGTLLAVFVVFWGEIFRVVNGFVAGLKELSGRKGWREVYRENESFRLGWYVIFGTIPVVVAGLTLRTWIEGMFSNGILAMIMVFITGEILWLTRIYSRYRPEGDIRLSDAVIMGVAQAFALVPGISRSGSTIALGMMRGVERNRAATFSFLLVIPATLGATIVESRHVMTMSAEALPFMAIGILASALVGYVALRVLLQVVRRGKLHWFAYYCWAVAMAGAALCWAKAY